MTSGGNDFNYFSSRMCSHREWHADSGRAVSGSVIWRIHCCRQMSREAPCWRYLSICLSVCLSVSRCSCGVPPYDRWTTSRRLVDLQPSRFSHGSLIRSLSTSPLTYTATPRYFYIRSQTRIPFRSVMIIIRPPGTTVPDGLMFYPWCFLGSHISEVPRPIATKPCHMIGIWLKRSRKFQKFGVSPLKNLGAKNMQNFCRFFATSDFDCEYLRNGLRYPNHNSQFFLVIIEKLMILILLVIVNHASISTRQVSYGLNVPTSWMTSFRNVNFGNRCNRAPYAVLGLVKVLCIYLGLFIHVFFCWLFYLLW